MRRKVYVENGNGGSGPGETTIALFTVLRWVNPIFLLIWSKPVYFLLRALIWFIFCTDSSVCLEKRLFDLTYIEYMT